MSLVSIGLLIISLAWLIQLAFSWKGNKEIQPVFILCYAFGVLLVAIGAGMDLYQFGTLITSLLVLIRIITLKK